MSFVFFCFSPGGPWSALSVTYFPFPREQDCQVPDSKDRAFRCFLVLRGSERMVIVGQLLMVSIAVQVALCGSRPFIKFPQTSLLYLAVDPVSSLQSLGADG